MTDRYNALTVVLADDTRADDCEDLITAIRQLRGVADVLPHTSNISDATAKSLARIELRNHLLQLVQEQSW